MLNLSLSCARFINFPHDLRHFLTSFFVLSFYIVTPNPEPFCDCVPGDACSIFIQLLAAKHSPRFSMASLRALYLNFKDDYGDLLEVTDFSIATWLAFGASLQLLSQSWLNPQLSYLIPLVYLVYRVARVSIDCRRIFTGTFTNVVFGRWSATLPEPENPLTVSATSDGVVMFLLGARINQFVSVIAPPRRVRDWQGFADILQSSGQTCTRQCRD